MRVSGRSLAAACALRARYERLVAGGVLRHDAAQLACVERLSQLHSEVTAHAAAAAEHARALAAHAAAREAALRRLEAAALARAAEAARQTPPPPPPPSQGGWFSSLLAPAAPSPPRAPAVDRAALEAAAAAEAGPPPPPPRAPRGLYLHGGVGVGKTLLMDLFYDAAVESVGAGAARRVHFNAFSQRVHAELHALERRGGTDAASAHAARAALLAARRRRSQASAGAAASGADVANAAVLSEVAAAILPPELGTGLLCFDEFEVGDAFTAVALKGVLEALLARGVTLVLTSNRAPRDMHGGAAQQRALFDAFAGALERRCEAWPLDAAADYRAALSAAHGPSRLRLPAHAGAAMDALHAAACAGAAPRAEDVPVLFGRRLRVPHAAAGVARASFEELCARPLGAADYIALAERYHTLFLDDVPAMSAGTADVARRFITLVDELYNARCVLVYAGAAPPEALFSGCGGGGGGDGAPLVDLEALQFESEAEGARSRRDVAADGGVAPVAASAAGMAGAVAALSGAAERFAFARAASRLAELGTPAWVRRSRAPAAAQDALLQQTR